MYTGHLVLAVYGGILLVKFWVLPISTTLSNIPSVFSFSGKEMRPPRPKFLFLIRQALKSKVGRVF